MLRKCWPLLRAWARGTRQPTCTNTFGVWGMTARDHLLSQQLLEPTPLWIETMLSKLSDGGFPRYISFVYHRHPTTQASTVRFFRFLFRGETEELSKLIQETLGREEKRCQLARGWRQVMIEASECFPVTSQRSAAALQRGGPTDSMKHPTEGQTRHSPSCSLGFIASRTLLALCLKSLAVSRSCP